MRPPPAPYGLIVKLDASGQIVASMHNADGDKAAGLTSAEEHGGWLYLANCEGDKMARLALGR